jgi:hypothetical protein
MPLSWYNENAGRAYPLRQDRPRLFVLSPGGAEVALPDELLVEAAFVMGIDASAYDPAAGVEVAAVRRQAGVVEIDCVAAGVPGALTFAAPESLPEWSAARAERAAAGTEVPDTLWEGHLVLGRLAPLLALVPEGGSLAPAAAGSAAFEPALVQRVGPRLRSLNLANLPRPRTDLPPPGPPEDAEAVVVARGLAGDVGLADGYNLLVRARARDGALELVPGVGFGLGEPHGEVPMPGEEPPDDSGLLSGGPSCAQVVQSFAGVSAPLVTLRGGPTIRVLADPDDPHGILILPLGSEG